jgi:hypothetical protein
MTTAPFLPTRLVFLGKPGNNPRLIETANMRLEPSSSPPLRYTTLSYRWGKVHPLKLTTETRCQLSYGIPCQDLPKTFADAIEITRSLGLEHIWIDALCIVQDDERDWERECTRMADVYRHGYCNVAALEAEDSHGGCFSAWDPTLYSPVVVESRWRNQSSALWVHRPTLVPPEDEIDEAPVHQRAWVLQERLMSRRVLHFGRNRIIWECKETLKAECDEDTELWATFPRSDLQYPIRYFGTVNHAELSRGEARSLVQVWFQGVVPRYTAAGLTYQSDKYMAISALARAMHHKLNSSTDRKPDVAYLAGLWSLDLEYQLLWSPSHPETATRLSETGALTAPSWSWASLNGRVHPLLAAPPPLSGHPDDIELISHVTGYRLSPMSGDPFFGPKTRSRSVLQIKGPCWKRLVPDSGDGRGGTRWDPGEEPIIPIVGIELHIDTTADRSTLDTEPFLLPIAILRTTEATINWCGGNDTRFPYIWGLVVQQVDQPTETMAFRRIGYFALLIHCQLLLDTGTKGWQGFRDKLMPLCLEHRMFWPNQLNSPSLQDATEVTGDILEKAASFQTISLE